MLPHSLRLIVVVLITVVSCRISAEEVPSASHLATTRASAMPASKPIYATIPVVGNLDASKVNGILNLLHYAQNNGVAYAILQFDTDTGRNSDVDRLTVALTRCRIHTVAFVKRAQGDSAKAANACSIRIEYGEPNGRRAWLTEQGRTLGDVRRILGLPTWQSFDDVQQVKGLAQFQYRWLPTAEVAELKKELDRADTYVMGKARRNAAFRVFQSLPDGALCTFDNIADDMFGNVFKLVDAGNKLLADGDKYACDLYWAGTYTYITKGLDERTVNCYSFNREIAKGLVRSSLFPRVADMPKTDLPKLSPPETRKPNVPSDNAAILPASTGSGFIVTRNGYLLTNYHVIEDAGIVKVMTPKGMLPAKVVAQDPNNDLAILKVNGDFSPATFAPERTARLGQGRASCFL